MFKTTACERKAKLIRPQALYRAHSINKNDPKANVRASQCPLCKKTNPETSWHVGSKW